MSGEQITKCIDFLNKKISSLTGADKTKVWEESKKGKGK